MGSSVWPSKRIRVLDLFDIKFGGKKGRDEKVVVFPKGRNYHYTLKIPMTSESITTRLTLDLHKTWPGPAREYLSLAKGYLDMQPLIKTITQEIRPSIQSVDFSSSEWREAEVLPVGILLASTLQTRWLDLTPDWTAQFVPVRLSELDLTSPSVIIPVDHVAPSGVVVGLNDGAYMIHLPSIKTFEDRFGENLKMEYYADIEGELEDALDESED